MMTHAMLFTGVDVRRTAAHARWRVENSWGDEKADKGFWTMNDNWFGEHVFEIAVRRIGPAAGAAGGSRRGADRAAGVGPDGLAGRLTPDGRQASGRRGAANRSSARSLLVASRAATLYASDSVG